MKDDLAGPGSEKRLGLYCPQEKERERECYIGSKSIVCESNCRLSRGITRLFTKTTIIVTVHRAHFFLLFLQLPVANALTASCDLF